MTRDKWEQIKGQVKDSFSVITEGTESGEIEDELIDFIEWQGRDGYEWRAEWHDKPKMKAKKTIYSRRAGSQTVEQIEYDPEERVQFVRFFRRLAGDEEWQLIDAENLW